MPMRRAVLALALVVLVAGLAFVGWRIALQRLHGAVLGALGPRAQVAAIELGWSAVVLRELRIAGDGRSWPAADELRARELRIAPDLRSLFGGGWRVHRVEVHGGYVSLLRTRDGRLRVLPSLLGERASGGGAKGDDGDGFALRIDRVLLRDAAIDFHDASIRSPGHRLRFTQLRADIGPLVLPALDVPLQIDLSAQLEGPQRKGRLDIDGELTPASRDARLNASLAGADLMALQPYLLRQGEGAVRGGTLDLTLDAQVQRQQLRAPGTVRLSGLELASGDGLLGTFAGVPRQAVLAAMGRDGRIEVRFVLEGRLDDPKFSLNENFALRLAGGMAQALGVSVGGVVEGVGNVIKGLLGR